MRWISFVVLMACTEATLPGEGTGPTGEDVATISESNDCSSVTTHLAIDEVSPAGFSAAEVDALLVGERNAEIAYADGFLSTVHVDVSAGGAPTWVDYSEKDAGASCPADELVAEYQIHFWTDDGQFEGRFSWTFRGEVLPEDLFANDYLPPGELEGAVAAPAGTDSLSVVMHHRADGSTNGVLQWVVYPENDGMATEVDVAEWGSYRQ